MADLELTLSWLGMSQYLDRFLDAGFDSWEIMLEITENDLEILNVDLGHRRKLQKEIANTKRLAQDPAFVQPLYGIVPSPQSRREPLPLHNERETATKRGYRHHPKPDPNAPERPYSAYVLFSNHTRDQLKLQKLSFTNLSKIVGERWQAMSPEGKDEWKQQGAGPWEDYKTKLAEYQRTEECQAYQDYVADFKATQAAKKPARRQSTTQNAPSARRTPARNPPEASVSPSQRRFGTSVVGGQEPSWYGSRTAIKKLKREEESWGEGEKPRAPRSRQACESCRRRKIKCDGGQPTCRQCTDNDSECFYESTKRETKRWENDHLWHKVKVYEGLLLQFITQVDDDDQQAIQAALLLPPQLNSSGEAYKVTSRSRQGSETASCRGHGESEASGVGSMGSTGRVNEQLFSKDSHPMAFAGQASDAKWVERLKTELDRDDGESKNIARTRKSAVDEPSQTNMEDMDLSIVGNQLYPFELPLKDTADRLVNAYFTSIHLSFPLLRQSDFMAQYEEVYHMVDLTNYFDRMFLATLQLVLAIGAVHAHLINAAWAGDGRDHVLYFAHARVLAVDTGVLNDTCYLGQVQIFALGGLYLLVTDQINRSWNLTGLSIRSAQSLGLHLMNVTPSLNVAGREFHALIWHAIAALEAMLTVVTGRPSMVNERDCNVSLVEIPGFEDRSSTIASPSGSSHRASTIDFSNRGSSASVTSSSHVFTKRPPVSVADLYFLHYTGLCALTKEVVGQLYRPGIREKKWSDIKEIISDFDNRLLRWKNDLHPPFDVATPSVNAEIESCRVALRILFHSTRTIINRPCLCRTDRGVVNQTRSSKLSTQSFANTCVDSARAVLNLILNKPDSTVLHRGAMWWIILHHLRRALTIVLLELSFRAEHMPADAGELLKEAKAAIDWLRQISSANSTAKRTWTTMSVLLRQAARRVGGNTSDIITASEDPSYDPQFSMDLGRDPQVPLFAPDNLNNSNSFPSLGGYGEFPDGQGYTLADLAGNGEWDEFGFLRAQGGQGSFFPQDEDMGQVGQGQTLGQYGLNQWLDHGSGGAEPSG